MVRIFSQTNVQKSQGAKAYTEATLFPILTVDKLFPEIEKDHYLSRIQGLVTLPEDYFALTYSSLIDNFAYFVQVLPEQYGDELGGLFHDGLRRALLASQLVKDAQVNPHPLFQFAIFSIALLADVGQILKYCVMISDDKGIYIDDWSPYLGYMSEYGHYYKLRPYEDTPTSLIRNATPLLARQLLSDTALSWLSMNNQIFDMWLAFLNKGEDWAGGLAKILKIERNQFINRRDESGLVPIDIKTFEPMSTDLAEKFLAWLKNGLEAGEISYNASDSLVHVIQMNEYQLSVFLQAPELFQKFVGAYPKARDWVVVCKQFNHLGLTKLSGGDLKFDQFFAESADSKASSLGFLKDKKGSSLRSKDLLASANNFKEGMVVKDAKMLFGSKKPLASSQYLQGVERRWGLDNVLPKTIRSHNAPAVTYK